MNKKMILPLVLVAAAVIPVAGCGKKTIIVQSGTGGKNYSTAQELASAVEGNLKKVNSCTIDEYFKIDAKISAYGQSSDMNMEGKGSGELQMEPAYAHLNLNLSQKSSAGSASTSSETYISGTGADAKGYIKTDGSSWTKDSSITGIEFDALLEQFMGNQLIEAVSSGAAAADIDNNGGSVNGKDTYKISARVNGDIAGASFSDSLSSMQTVSADWSNLYADMDLYIYKDSELPAKITVDGADFLKGIMDGMGIDCKVSEYTGEFTIDNYDAASAGSLAIPDSVILEAGDSLPMAATGDSNSGQLSKKDSEVPTTTATTEATTDAASNKGEYYFYDSDTRLLTEADLEGMSAEELRKARNEIVARHGRKFNDEALRAYFSSKSWYKPTVDPDVFDADVEGYLNSTEIKNTEFIKSVEDKLSGGANNANEGMKLSLKPAIQDFRALTYGQYKEKYNDTAEYSYGAYFWETDYMVPDLNVNASFAGVTDWESDNVYSLPDTAPIIHVQGVMGDLFDGINKTVNFEELLNSLSVPNGAKAYSDIGYTHSAASYYPVVIFDGDGDGNADDYVCFYDYVDMERADNVSASTWASLGKLPIKW